ncbi:MFS transporter [Knoellia sp. 3-2P3]|uniref:MFS transporter n=1 Tax=unclassified Knoellia TaxID=2618719 RepID=UPI0023DAB7ED|nr:MFS transporter [Knoellia sp. 3-2P3]MDF2094161.1 MFS transporter [Knoellia sp. 3-2P3]
MPSYREVLRVPAFLPFFLASSLSTWGDYIARITVAAVVFERTGSAVATAATFAVSMLPSVFGRMVLSPFADRLPYKYVLIGSHLVRAAFVIALLAATVSSAPVGLLLVLLFLLELAGGPTVAANQMLLTDLFTDRRLYSKAFGLTTLAEQTNQAIGLAVGGLVVTMTSPVQGLFFDLVTFLVAAAVLAVVVPRRDPVGMAQEGISGFVRDVLEGGRHLFHNRVLTSLLLLSITSTLAMAAPEAVAIPYVNTHTDQPGWGGMLMAAPILGAVVGLLVVSRFGAEEQNRSVLAMALVMPLPLLVTVFEPPLPAIWGAWFACGALQAYMLPLQSTFTLMVPAELRGRVFGLAGALSVAATGAFYLLAGWISQHTTPAAAIGVCAIASLGGLVLVAARWPRTELADAVHRTFSLPEGTSRAA